MTRYNNKGEIETISAKMVFHIVEKIGVGSLGVKDNGGIDVYLMENTENEKRFVIDCGKGVRFSITRLIGKEEYELKNNDWIWVEGDTYQYTSYSTTFNGAPYLPIDKAYDKIKNLL